MLAGDNDYRTVDIPGIPGHGRGTRRGCLVGRVQVVRRRPFVEQYPLAGYQQDTSLEGRLSPLKSIRLQPIP